MHILVLGICALVTLHFVRERATVEAGTHEQEPEGGDRQVAARQPLPTTLVARRPKVLKALMTAARSYVAIVPPPSGIA